MSVSSTNHTSSFNSSEVLQEGQDAIDEMLRKGKGGRVTISGPSISGTPGNVQYQRGTVKVEHGHDHTTTTQVASEAIETNTGRGVAPPNHQTENSQLMQSDAVIRGSNGIPHETSSGAKGVIYPSTVTTTYHTDDLSRPKEIRVTGGGASYSAEIHRQGFFSFAPKTMTPKKTSGAMIAGGVASGVVTGVIAGISGASVGVTIGAIAGVSLAGTVAGALLLWGVLTYQKKE